MLAYAAFSEHLLKIVMVKARVKTNRVPVSDRILATASALFYREGVHNVGVDRIIAESGVAKMSLYNHFNSKDVLIAAYLEERNATWGVQFPKTVESLTDDPQARLLAVFDVLHDWFGQPSFRGCAFINSTIELANPTHTAVDIAMQHKQMIYDCLLDWAEDAGTDDPEALAQQLAILVDGAIVVAMRQGGAAAIQAKQAAAILIQNSLA